MMMILRHVSIVVLDVKSEELQVTRHPPTTNKPTNSSTIKITLTFNK